MLGFNEIEELYFYEFMGWDGLWLLNILHNNISKIAGYAFFNLNQLRELDTSNNAESSDTCINNDLDGGIVLPS